MLTVVGILYLLKTVRCFFFPGVSLRSLNRVTVERSRLFIAPGVALLTLALVICHALVRGTREESDGEHRLSCRGSRRRKRTLPDIARKSGEHLAWR